MKGITENGNTIDLGLIYSILGLIKMHTGDTRRHYEQLLIKAIDIQIEENKKKEGEYKWKNFMN